jgi:glycosyltransferase involved in cell wall biosynthesis
MVLTSFERGGTERQMTELIRRLDPARFEVHVACFRREGPWLAGVRTHAASVAEFRLGSFKSVVSLHQLIRLSAWFRERRVSVVHACDLYANIAALPAAAIAGVATRIGSRRGIVAPVSTPGLLPLQRLAYAAAHRVVANSAAAATVLRAEGVPVRKVVVIPNGIETPGATIATVAPVSTARATRRIVTTVANLRTGKGHDVLLDAAVRVRKVRGDASFLLVGDGPLRPALERQAASLGLGDGVRFVGLRDDIDAILRETDVFALPSLMEAFPNALMEAMAAGLPIVATNTGGVPELVTSERTGLLVAPGDPGALACAILRLLADRELAEALGTAAREVVARDYSYDRMVRAFEALYSVGSRASRCLAPAPEK